jgi:hypothetical protein
MGHNMNSTCAFRVLTSAILVFCFSAPSAVAQNWSDVHNKARGAVLFVQTVIQKRDGTNRTVSTGTAFVVSDLGFALTVAHLVPRAAADEIAEYRVALEQFPADAGHHP